MTTEKIRQLAWKSRRWIEALAQRPENDFIDPEDMEGGCALAAAHLATLLFEAGERFELCKNSEHCFIRWRHYVVDVTATQFGEYPKVVVRPIGDEEDEEFWVIQSSMDMPGTVNRFNEVMERAQVEGKLRDIGLRIPEGTLLHMLQEFYDGAWAEPPLGTLVEKTLGQSCRALRRRR